MSNHHQNDFSTVELLVALIVAAMLLGGAYQLYLTVQDTTQAA